MVVHKKIQIVTTRLAPARGVEASVCEERPRSAVKSDCHVDLDGLTFTYYPSL